MSDVQSALLWLILLSIFTFAMSTSVCVVIHHFNQRLVKLESRDFNKDLRMVWDKIGSLQADNAGRDYRITKLESEEYFGDTADDVNDDDEIIDLRETIDREAVIRELLDGAIGCGGISYNGFLYRITPERNEG
jgi:hypothetical protein